MKTGRCYSPKNGHTGWDRSSSSMLHSLANIPWDHFSAYSRPHHSRPEEGNSIVPVPVGGLRVGAYRRAFPVCREPSSSPAFCKEGHGAESRDAGGRSETDGGHKGVHNQSADAYTQFTNNQRGMRCQAPTGIDQDIFPISWDLMQTTKSVS